MSGVLVVFYTRNNHCRQIAHEIATKLHGRIDQITDSGRYIANMGSLFAVWDSYFEKSTSIKYQMNPEDYTAVIVVSPVWASKIPPPVRAYLKENIAKMKNYGFILADNKPVHKKTTKHFNQLMPKALAEFTTLNQDIDQEIFQKYLEDFADRIRIVIEKEDCYG
jgi:menaquinone-dependent protoporphyrinogen IX oxidase